MAGNRNSGRRPGHGKSIEQHKIDGTYRPGRHGEREERERQLFLPPVKPEGIINDGPKSQRKWVRSAADEYAVAQGCRFNEPLALHVVNCFRSFFRHSKGQWAGEPFELTDWQRDNIIYPVFGWVRPDGTRRIRRTYIEIPKKNYKSTTASGIGLYMLTCDGEMGAEVYSLGADKDQARVVHGEAINMIEASEDLTPHLFINRTTGVISYPQTKSWYKVLSGAWRGKSGPNVHCAIADELHEWRGNELWNAMRYGSRARLQPLFFVITNAGDDTESVCYKQREKAKDVLHGKSKDFSFYPLICDATKEEVDEELAAVRAGSTEIPVAARCNPGYGHVIKHEDLLTDIRDSIDNPSERANLLRFTYSIWVTSASPWLDSVKWEACEVDCGHVRADGYDWKYIPGKVNVEGLPCWAGLDLSKNRDFTALTLCFADPDEERYWQMPLFWLPEETAEKRSNLASYLEWADDGFIKLLPGDTIDYPTVENDIVSLVEQFNIREVMFDPYKAEHMRQRLEGRGIECVKFEQSPRAYANPTDDYERAINNGTLHHGGHPILTWQSQHVQVQTDRNGNKKPVKPKHGDHKTIDGIIAGVMAFAGAMTGDVVEPSFYDEHDLEVA